MKIIQHQEMLGTLCPITMVNFGWEKGLDDFGLVTISALPTFQGCCEDKIWEGENHALYSLHER